MPAKKKITKDKILATALTLLQEQGYEAITIKTLAKELGCSTQPIYLSFSGMDELRGELVPLAVKQFETFMRANSEDGKIRLYGMAYIQFAKQEPKLFQFVFMRANAFSEIKKILVPITQNTMRELAEQYSLTMEEADYLHDQLWMHAHGIASMIATDFCDWDMNKVEHMLAACQNAFLGKYEA